MITFTLIAQTLTAHAEESKTVLDRIDGIVFVLLAVLAGYQKWRASKATGILDVVIAGVETYKATLPKAEAKRVTGIISAVATEEGAEPALHKEVKRVTEGARVAYAPPPDDPPAPPRLGAAAVLLVALALLSGCIAPAARDLAVAHEAHLRAFDGASAPHPSYLVDDAEPGADGKRMTAAEKVAAWKAARKECLESARALAEALK